MSCSKSGNTVGVFQLESEGMRRTLAAVKPTSFERYHRARIALSPGPDGQYSIVRQAQERVKPKSNIRIPKSKPNPQAETYGIFVYQEQVMQAAQILAGYSLGDADLLRRAMGKKVQAEMDAQRQRFVDGCKEVSGIEKGKANELFDLIDKFAGYGFNKSHAAAYALLAYQTAWLKAHYPEEFYAASMCFDMHHSEKLALFVDDARRHDIVIAPPSMNRSVAEFSVEQTDDGYAVRYALAGIRNVGEKAMDALVQERNDNGRFETLKDLFERLPPGSMNRRQLEGLVCAGALDEFEPNRGMLFENIDLLLATADAATRERESGQAALFAGDDSASDGLRLKQVDDWSRPERMAKERENFGFYFSAHPVQQYWTIASANGARTFQSLMEAGAPPGGRQAAVMAAMVESVNKGKTRRGKDFVRADFSDSTGQFSAACFEEGLVEKFQKWSSESTSILLNVELDSPSPDEPPRITVRGGRPLEEIKGGSRMLLTLELSDAAALHDLKMELVPGTPGHGEVLITLKTGTDMEPLMRLGRDYALDGELAERVALIEGIDKVSLTTRRGGSHLRLVA